MDDCIEIYNALSSSHYGEDVVISYVMENMRDYGK